MNRSIRLPIATLLTVSMSSAASAQSSPLNLAQVSLEDLLNIEITSASRKEQRLTEVPAAVYVITQEDIRRSGLQTLPELFRLVPGMQVTQINSSNWAVSVRGFNSLFSNKLLVLVDGRTLYNRLYTGVAWSVQDLLLDDVERIEVIRGPGASIWGANAVNGVINIITKSAAETAGALARVAGGSFEGQTASFRYGGAAGKTSYRVSSQWTGPNESTFGGGVGAQDSWKSVSVGGRLDRAQGAHALMVQAQFTDADTNQSRIPNLPGSRQTASETEQGSVLARWTLNGRAGRSLSIQSFVNTQRAHPDGALATNSENMVDLDLQYHAPLAGRQDVVIGGGVRYSNDLFQPTAVIAVEPSSSASTLSNLFVQDDITLGRGVSVTFGAKVEHASIVGWNLQPTARAMWKVGQSQHIWAAMSRALRSPAPFDLGIHLNVPLPPIGGLPAALAIRGNPDYRTEKFRDSEVGYRVAFGSTTSVDVTAFRGHYSDLPMLQPFAPVFDISTGSPQILVPLVYTNLLEADTKGAEVATRWMAWSRFSLDGSYSYLRIERRNDRILTGALDPPALTDNSAGHQWQLRSALQLHRRAELDASLYRIGRVAELGTAAYTRADVRLDITLRDRLSVAVAGRNLTSREHAEAAGDGSDSGVVPTLIPRSIGVQMRWQF